MNAVSTERIYSGRVLNLRVDEIPHVRGEGTRRVEVVEHAGGVVIVARPDPSRIVLVKQYRHPTGTEQWEAPAGMIERGEPPMETARRELLEETGYRAHSLRFLFSLYSTPGFCEERIHLFAADGLEAGRAQPEDDESFELRVWTIEEAWQAVLRDELRDAKTQVALAWARAQTA